MEKHLKFHWITIWIDCKVLRSLKVVRKFDLNSYYHGQHNFLKVSQKYFYSTQTQSISSQCTKSTIKLSYATNFSQLSEEVVWVMRDKTNCSWEQEEPEFEEKYLLQNFDLHFSFWFKTLFLRMIKTGKRKL